MRAATVQEILTGELRCLQCSRTAATARVLAGRLRVKLSQHEHAEAVKRLRCPSCGGNLQLVDTAYEVVRHFYLTPSDLVPKRGRPAKVVAR